MIHNHTGYVLTAESLTIVHAALAEARTKNAPVLIAIEVMERGKPHGTINAKVAPTGMLTKA